MVEKIRSKTDQSRSPDFAKGGGFFWSLIQPHTNLTRIFICFQLDWDKSRAFFCPKSCDLQKKKKKVFTEIQSVFLSKIKWSPKKKSPKSRAFFCQLTPTSTIYLTIFGGGYFCLGGGYFCLGGLFPNLGQKSTSKLLKTCYFEYFSGQWAIVPFAPPPSYATKTD